MVFQSGSRMQIMWDIDTGHIDWYGVIVRTIADVCHEVPGIHPSEVNLLANYLITILMPAKRKIIPHAIIRDRVNQQTVA
jgi:hypothetical protein